MNKVIFIFLLILSVLPGYGELVGYDNIEFEHLSIGEGLSQGSVFCIMQDSKGFMWIGTYEGVNKYDGNKFTVYRNDPTNPHSLGGNYVWNIYEDRSGTIWIATWGWGLNKFDREKESFTSYRIKNGNNDVDFNNNIFVSVCEDRTGTLWVGTRGQGLCIFDREKEVFHQYKHDPGTPGSLSSNFIDNIYEDRYGTLWIGTHNGLNKWNREKRTFSHFQCDPHDTATLYRFDGQNYISAINEDNTGQLWIGTGSGSLYIFDREKETFEKAIQDFHRVCTCRIDSICPDQQGLLWVGTSGEGIFVIAPAAAGFSRVKVEPGNPQGLSENDVQAIYMDHSGLIWIGTFNNGINVFDKKRKKFDLYRHIPGNPNSLSNDLVASIIEDRDGIVWLGTHGGGLNRLDRKTNRFSCYKFHDTNSTRALYNSVFYLYEDRSGRLWLGTNEGFKQFDRENETFISYPRCFDASWEMSDNRIVALCEDHQGMIWIATTHKGLRQFDPEKKTFAHYRHDPGNPASLGSDSIYSLYVDRSGTLWVGTEDRGVDKFDSQTQTFLHYQPSPSAANCLSSKGVFVFHEDRSGILWLGTMGGGLNRFDREKEHFRRYTTKDGLPSDSIYGILEDREENLWLSTVRGICRFEPKTGKVRCFGPRDGLQGYEFAMGSCFKNSNGEMFFGGGNGFNVFCPENVPLNRHVPEIAITDFKIFNKPVPIGADSPLKKHISETREVVLPYSANIISFEFAALDYTAPGQNLYQYKLEGFNDGWIDAGNKHDVMFTNLDPREYILRVRGSNNDGIWNNQGASIIIIITPPFWKTWWFQTLIVLLLAVLFYTWHDRRMKNLSLRLKSEAEMERFFSKYGISNREQEIIHLILKGKTNKDIEDALFISIKTVKSHIYNIYQKVGVKNRLELIRLLQGSLK